MNINKILERLDWEKYRKYSHEEWEDVNLYINNTSLFTLDFIKEFIHRIDLFYVTRYIKLKAADWNELYNNYSDLFPTNIATAQPYYLVTDDLYTQTLSHHSNMFDVYAIMKYQKCDENFIFNFVNLDNPTNFQFISWVLRWQKLSPETLSKIMDNPKFSKLLKDEVISRYQILTEDFIDKYQNELNWDFISRNQILSEEFIEKHSNKIKWTELEQNRYLILSKKFISVHKDKFSWNFFNNRNMGMK